VCGAGGRRGRRKAADSSSQVSATGSHGSPGKSSKDDEEARETQEMRALTEESPGVLTQKMRPHVRRLRKMLQKVQDAAKKFVVEMEHPEILDGWIWSTSCLPVTNDGMLIFETCECMCGNL
jgi:hypothetical protein